MSTHNSLERLRHRSEPVGRIERRARQESAKQALQRSSLPREGLKLERKESSNLGDTTLVTCESEEKRNEVSLELVRYERRKMVWVNSAVGRAQARRVTSSVNGRVSFSIPQDRWSVREILATQARSYQGRWRGLRVREVGGGGRAEL